MHTIFEQLTSLGYCKVNHVLPQDLLLRLRKSTTALLEAKESQTGPTNQGTLLPLTYEDTAFVDLITLPRSINLLREMGFARPSYTAGFIISRKRVHKSPLYWHQDWFFWDEPESAQELPHQLFLMFYLTDTSKANGCLRVIPRSHLNRFDLHDDLGTGHDSDIRSSSDMSHPLFAIHKDEVDVPVSAGDVVIGDARLLHSSYPNSTDSRRTVITLWYLPRIQEASARVQAGFRQTMYIDPTESANEKDLKRLRPLMSYYDGDCEPAKYNRVPEKYPR